MLWSQLIEQSFYNLRVTCYKVILALLSNAMVTSHNMKVSKADRKPLVLASLVMNTGRELLLTRYEGLSFLDILLAFDWLLSSLYLSRLRSESKLGVRVHAEASHC